MKISRSHLSIPGAALCLGLLSCGADAFKPIPVEKSTPASSDTTTGSSPQAGKSGDTNSNAPSGGTAGNQTADTQNPQPGADNTAPNTVAPPPAPTAPAPSGAASTGTVALSFTPIRYPAANYPAFVYAIWVTDSGGRYVKTIDARAATRIRYLNLWLTAAGVAANTATAQNPDGNTGASISFPGTPAAIAKTWDLKDKAGVAVPQGNYIINFQMTSANNAGVNLQVPITIGPAGATKADTSQTTGITAVSVKHTP